MGNSFPRVHRTPPGYLSVCMPLYPCVKTEKNRLPECLGVLIDVPKYEHPIYVSSAQVRWSIGQEFGMEFTHIEGEDRQRLVETVREVETAAERE